jgi:hypothetical protein
MRHSIARRSWLVALTLAVVCAGRGMTQSTEANAVDVVDLDSDSLPDLTLREYSFNDGRAPEPELHELEITAREVLATAVPGQMVGAVRLEDGEEVPSLPAEGTAWRADGGAVPVCRWYVRNEAEAYGSFRSSPGCIGFRFRSALGMRSGWRRMEAIESLGDPATASWLSGCGNWGWEPRRGTPAIAGRDGGIPGWAVAVRKTPLDLDRDGAPDADLVVARYSRADQPTGPGAEHAVSIVPRVRMHFRRNPGEPLPGSGSFGAMRVPAGEKIDATHPSIRFGESGEPLLLWSGQYVGSGALADTEGEFAREGGYLAWFQDTAEGPRTGWVEFGAAGDRIGRTGFARVAGDSLTAGSEGPPPGPEARFPHDLDGDGLADLVVLRSPTGSADSLATEAIRGAQLLADEPDPTGVPRAHLAQLRRGIGPVVPAGSRWLESRRPARLVRAGSESAATTGQASQWYVPVRLPVPEQAGHWRYGYAVVSTNGDLARSGGWTTDRPSLVDTDPDAGATEWTVDLDQDGLVDLAGYAKTRTATFPYTSALFGSRLTVTDRLNGVGIRSFGDQVLAGPLREFQMGGSNPPFYDTSAAERWHQVETASAGEVIHAEPGSASSRAGWYFQSADLDTFFPDRSATVPPGPCVPFHFRMADGWHAGWLATSPRLLWYLHPVAGEAIRAGTALPASRTPAVWVDPLESGIVVRWLPASPTLHLEAMDPLARTQAWHRVPDAAGGVYRAPATAPAGLFRVVESP